MSGAPNSPVILGPLRLVGLEVPESFTRDGTMQPVVHRLIGGGRVVQLMGGDPRTRKLRGILTGPGAVDRALALEALRDSGVAVALAIGAWVEQVVVTALSLDYASQGSVIRYELQAEALPASPDAFAPTLGGVVGGALSDLGAAIAAAAAPGSGLATSVAALSTSVASLAAGATPTPVLSTTAAATGLSAAIASSDVALAGIAASSGADLVTSPGDLQAALGEARSLAAATQAGGYVNRAQQSISALSGTTAAPAIHA